MWSRPTIETYTRCGVPVRDAAATRRRVASTSPRALVAQCTMAATPFTAASSPFPVLRSPTTYSTPSAASGRRRVSTRTSRPASRSPQAIRRPRRPVPPVTSTCSVIAPPSVAGPGALSAARCYIDRVRFVSENDGSRTRKVTGAMTVDGRDCLAERFEAHRPRLWAVAYRMLGSPSDAEDAVQEAWLRLSRADPGGVQNLGGWLTTVVGRVCLDMLRARASRREEVIAPQLPDSAGTDPQQEAELADSLGSALLVVMDTLTPAERLAFVLHDVFGVAFKEIAPILSRTPSATKMLASRARRRVRTSSSTVDADPLRQRRVVGAFLAAVREGDFPALLTMLAPGVVLRPDRAAVQAGARPDIRGASAV